MSRRVPAAIFAAIGGLAILASGPSSARADLFLDVLVNGSSILGPIADGGPGDLNTATGAISVDIGALNTALAGAGIPLEFDSVEASSNQSVSPLTNVDATLTQSGAVRYTVAGGAPLAVTVLATDHDYLHPNGPFKSLDSGASANFTNVVPGNQDVFGSFFDPSNNHFTTGPPAIPSPASILLPNLAQNPSGAANTAATTGLGAQGNPFALTNRSDLIIGPSTSASSQAKIAFAGSTVVTATVPEPASLVLVSLGGAVFVLAARSRKGRASA